MKNKKGITRNQFLVLLTGAVSFILGFKKRNRNRSGSVIPKRPKIRPPGAIEENEFIKRCIRCGNCMKVCPTNALQPALFETGMEGIWTPYLNASSGYCEYNCILCLNVCPTGAISKLSLKEKQKRKIGTAHINRNICLPWSRGEECLVCEEHCPIPDKAIKIIKEKTPIGTEILLPVVDAKLCIGCSICQNKCPVRPNKAITVIPN